MLTEAATHDFLNWRAGISIACFFRQRKPQTCFPPLSPASAPRVNLPAVSAKLEARPNGIGPTPDHHHTFAPGRR